MAVHRLRDAGSTEVSAPGSRSAGSAPPSSPPRGAASGDPGRGLRRAPRLQSGLQLQEARDVRGREGSLRRGARSPLPRCGSVRRDGQVRREGWKVRRRAVRRLHGVGALQEGRALPAGRQRVRQSPGALTHVERPHQVVSCSRAVSACGVTSTSASRAASSTLRMSSARMNSIEDRTSAGTSSRSRSLSRGRMMRLIPAR